MHFLSVGVHSEHFETVQVGTEGATRISLHTWMTVRRLAHSERQIEFAGSAETVLQLVPEA